MSSSKQNSKLTTAEPQNIGRKCVFRNRITQTQMSSKLSDYSYIYHIAHGLGHFINILDRYLGQTLKALSRPSSHSNDDTPRFTN